MLPFVCVILDANGLQCYMGLGLLLDKLMIRCIPKSYVDTMLPMIIASKTSVATCSSVGSQVSVEIGARSFKKFPRFEFG